MIDLKYIVTGTGRCGTLYMANLLTTFGFPCSHEGIFTNEGLPKALDAVKGRIPVSSSRISRKQNLSDYEMEIAAESSYMAAPFLNSFNSAQVIHVVRNPIDVVKSFVKKLNYFGEMQPRRRNYYLSVKNPEHHPEELAEDPLQFKFERFIYNCLPELEDDISQTDRACLYYVRWNKMIESSGNVKYFHRMEDGVEGLKKFFNFDGEEYYKEKCNILLDKKDAFEPQFKKIKPCIKKELMDISMKYGYVKGHKIY